LDLTRYRKAAGFFFACLIQMLEQGDAGLDMSMPPTDQMVQVPSATAAFAKLVEYHYNQQA
jgi:hypothetical protein